MSSINPFSALANLSKDLGTPELTVRIRSEGGLVWIVRPLTSQLVNSLTFFLHMETTSISKHLSFHVGSAPIKHISFLMGAQIPHRIPLALSPAPITLRTCLYGALITPVVLHVCFGS